MKSEDRLAWWRDARFGMFIHWGVYAVPGRGEWVYYQEHWGQKEYARLADRFNPQRYNPREWVRMAQDAGVRYMVITTRHHDGFCLYDSKVSEFTAPKTAAGRDLIAEFADACHDMGMRMGFYYSLEDWRFPEQLPHLPIREDKTVYEPMVEQAHAQVRELMTNYGQVDILWYDGGFPPGVWRAEELNAMVRQLQPGIIINNRSGPDEDYGTPENNIRPMERPWEACYTMNDSWGYAKWDRNYKSTTQILHLLSTCVANNGNLLMNVGPCPDGEFPAEAAQRFTEVGEWMRRHGAAIYGAGRSAFCARALGHAVDAGNRTYIHVWRWPGETAPFGWIGSKILRARVHPDGPEATVEQTGDRVVLRGLPQYPPDPYMPIIELEFDGKPAPSEPAYS